ncbi:MAG: LysR family transcriptional regulator [Xanthobacteraceae bacterium]
MDRLDAMSVLVAVVETGSFSAAGRKLDAPLPTISRKVSELEAHLKTQLLIRTTRKLALTDAGAVYVAACKRILEQVGEAERSASGEYMAPRGDLVVTAPIVFGRLHVLPAVTEFLKNYPEIDVRLLFSDRNVHLIDDHVDLAVRIGALADSSMVATRVGAVRCVVCMSSAYLAATGTPKVPDDLSALACISFGALVSSTSWSFTAMKARTEHTVPVHSRLSVNTAEAAICAAIAGVGVTRVLSYQAANAVAEGKLKIVLADYEPEPLPVNLVYLEQNLLPRKTRAFLDFVAPRIRESVAKADVPAR